MRERCTDNDGNCVVQEIDSMFESIDNGLYSQTTRETCCMYIPEFKIRAMRENRVERENKTLGSMLDKPRMEEFCFNVRHRLHQKRGNIVAFLEDGESPEGVEELNRKRDARQAKLDLHMIAYNDFQNGTIDGIQLCRTVWHIDHPTSPIRESPYARERRRQNARRARNNAESVEAVARIQDIMREGSNRVRSGLESSSEADESSDYALLETDSSS